MPSRTRLGEILVDRGLLTDRQLAAALQEQRRGGERLGQILIRLGLVDGDQVSSALSEQTRWVAASLTAGLLAFQPGAGLARTTTAQLSVSVQVLATASVALQSAKAVSANASPGNLSLACGGEPLMRVTYQRAHLEPQPAPATAAVSSPYVPAAPAYRLRLQPLSQAVVSCGATEHSVGLAAPAVQLGGDAMNVEIAY